MSFNLGISSHPTNRLGGMSSVGVYLYEDVYYRQWITEIALAFYEGRQDEFVWLDLVKQFRNPEKQQILPINLTKEIVDETSILYREDPIYQVVDENGKHLPEDQKLWEQIQEDCRYKMTMDKLDRWVKLLGTVLVKVSFVDPKTGQLVKKTEGGQVQLDILHGGVYDIRYGASPYYITELMIGFGTKFGGFSRNPIGGGLAGTLPSAGDLGAASVSAKQKISNPEHLASVDRIYWSANDHKIIDKNDNEYIVKNPYGIIPAVPFFNQDPAHYFFLPINEPLIYANHAINMRITDLNHIAKFQSFGVPVVSGVERPTSTRQGRPVDDFNILKSGMAQSKFGGLVGFGGLGAGGVYRNFDVGFGTFRDGNADANALGVSIGPDTAIAVGEKGDFKFAHPSADIKGLIAVIESVTDMIRINHGLRPKYKDTLPSSGFALLMEKIGVIEENRRRAKLFKEREQQLFQVIKTLWNTHNSKSGQKKFSEKATLRVSYVQPEFPVDPKTNIETIMMENKLLEQGYKDAYRKLYPHLDDSEINKRIKTRRKEKLDQTVEDAKIIAAGAKEFESAGLDAALYFGGKPQKEKEDGVTKPKIDNKTKHSEDSSKQGDKNSDPRK